MVIMEAEWLMMNMGANYNEVKELKSFNIFINLAYVLSKVIVHSVHLKQNILNICFASMSFPWESSDHLSDGHRPSNHLKPLGNHIETS